MKDSAYKISLDINEHGSQVALKAKQSDTGRKIHISLRAGGTPYTIAEDCYAVFEATKPDGSILYNACTIEGNEIIYEFTEQTCAAVGRSRCEIKLYGLDDKLITSPRFALLVDGTVYPDGRVESSNEFSALTQMVSDTLAVQKVASEAAEAANIATENANKTAQNASEATEDANQAALSAEASTEAANQAAVAATQAAQVATDAAALAAEKAVLAGQNAKLAEDNAVAAETATDGALQAAGEATAAADKAIRASTACMVIGKASGESISLYDAIDRYLVSCRIFGKTTQDGTPTPVAPVDIVSVGESGSIGVSVTGKNLCRIDSGTHTNAGITYTFRPDGSIKITGTATKDTWLLTGSFTTNITLQAGTYCLSGVTANSNILAYLIAVDADGKSYESARDSGNGAVYVYDKDVAAYYQTFIKSGATVNTTIYPQLELGSVSTEYEPYKGQSLTVSTPNGLGSVPAVAQDEINFTTGERIERTSVIESYAGEEINGAYISSTGELSNGATVRYVLDTPIVTPLSEEELAAYSALHTYKNNTTVSNDAGAYMELEYVMDAKKYIDSQISTGIIEARVG